MPHLVWTALLQVVIISSALTQPPFDNSFWNLGNIMPRLDMLPQMVSSSVFNSVFNGLSQMPQGQMPQGPPGPLGPPDPLGPPIRPPIRRRRPPPRPPRPPPKSRTSTTPRTSSSSSSSSLSSSTSSSSSSTSSAKKAPY